MPVAFDTGLGTKVTVSGTTVGVTLTVGSNPNRALVAIAGWEGNGATSPSVSGGGASWSAISGTDSGTNATCRSAMFACVNPNTGSQTIQLSWTGALANVVLVVASVYNVTQVNAFTGGTFGTAGTQNTHTLTFNSQPGDMAIDGVITLAPANNVGSPTQTQIDVTQGTSNGSGAASRAAGAASVSFQWTCTGATSWAHSSANVLPAALDEIFTIPQYIPMTPPRVYTQYG